MGLSLPSPGSRALTFLPDLGVIHLSQSATRTLRARLLASSIPRSSPPACHWSNAGICAPRRIDDAGDVARARHYEAGFAAKEAAEPEHRLHGCDVILARREIVDRTFTFLRSILTPSSTISPFDRRLWR